MPPPDWQRLDEVRDLHVQQLADMQMPELRDIPYEFPPEGLLAATLDWITMNPAAIRAAQVSRCASTDRDHPSWDVVLYSLVESNAMYLRKPDEMAQAIANARQGDFDEAKKHLLAAQEDIETVAKALNCTFVQLCDFSKQGPNGTWLHSGAFSGLFISNEFPFMGAAFKGTNSTRDITTDLDWTPVKPENPEVLWGAQTHRGFYLGLFGLFDVGSEKRKPMDMIIQGIGQFTDKGRAHFTGHSLGGAWSTLAYGEMLRLRSTRIGDLYSIASPRTCYLPFADEVKRYTPNVEGWKYVFRIVNRDDPVPTVPPRTESQVIDYPFVHIDNAWKLKSDAGPEKMDDEPPPVPPESVSDIVWNIKQHQTSDYYASWKHTDHSIS